MTKSVPECFHIGRYSFKLNRHLGITPYNRGEIKHGGALFPALGLDISYKVFQHNMDSSSTSTKPSKTKKKRFIYDAEDL